MKYRAKIDELYFFNQFQLRFFKQYVLHDEERIKTQGVFTLQPNGKHILQSFRKKEIPVSDYLPEDFIDYVLNDNSIMSIKDTPEFQTNLNLIPLQ